MPYWLSAFFAAICVYAVGHYDVLKTLSGGDLRTAAGVIAQVSATLAGFLLAVLSILATIVNTKLLRNMQKTGHYRFLLRRLFVNTAIFGVAVAVGVVTALSDPHRYLMYVLVYLFFLGLAVLIDVSSKLWMVLSHLHAPAESQGGSAPV